MNPADLDAAISSSAFNLDMLRKTLAAAGPVEAMVILPLLGQSIGILRTLEQLKAALREGKQ